MNEAPAPEPDRSALDIGVFMTLAALGLAALLGVTRSSTPAATLLP